jgi:hypothetical protein
LIAVIALIGLITLKKRDTEIPDRPGKKFDQAGRGYQRPENRFAKRRAA